MIRRLLTLGLLAGSLGLSVSRPAEAQSFALATTVAPAPASGTSALPAGCWACARQEVWGGYIDYCVGGQNPGWWNCVGGGGHCHTSSPGCGGGAALPVDVDGASQYVSVGAMLEVMARAPDAPGDVRRNCDGLIVARNQSAADIAAVRDRTGVLSL